MIFTKDKTEKTRKSYIFSLIHRSAHWTSALVKTDKLGAMRKTEITDMNCTISPNFKQGKIIYSIIEK